MRKEMCLLFIVLAALAGGVAAITLFIGAQSMNDLADFLSQVNHN